MEKKKITHKHHIVPKHMGGTDDPENLVELTIEEHAEAHRLLWEEHGKKEDWLAWQGLAGMIDKDQLVHEVLSNAGKKGGFAGKGVSGNRAKGGFANWEKNMAKVTEVLRANAKRNSELGIGGYEKGKWIWITNGIESKKHLKSEYIPKGWERGRHSRTK